MKFVSHPLNRAGWTAWIQPIKRGYRVKCCDCGLVHEIAFRIAGLDKPRVQYRARRARRTIKEAT